MDLTPKTDECIKMLEDANKFFFLFQIYSLPSEGCFDEPTKIIDIQNRIEAMFQYRLMPFTVISMPDNIDKETAKEDAKTNSMLQNISDFDIFWYVMKTYPLVTSDDLKNEFWAICPNLESIPKFLDVMRVKFENVNHSHRIDIDEVKEFYGYNKLIKTGISVKDANKIFCNLAGISEDYNKTMESIKDIYKTFRKMVEPQQHPHFELLYPETEQTKMINDLINKAQTQGNRQIKQQANQPPHFDRLFSETEQKKMFDGLIKNHFLSNDTDFEDFCRVFRRKDYTDNEKPFKHLQWTGKIKELNYFIFQHFPKQVNQWKIAVDCFLINNEKIKIKSLTTAIDKYDDIKTSDIINNLLN
jgi:hypothetical protein